MTGSGGGTTVTREDKVKQILDEIIEKLPEEFNMVEIMNKVEERTPYVLPLIKQKVHETWDEHLLKWFFFYLVIAGTL